MKPSFKGWEPRGRDQLCVRDRAHNTVTEFQLAVIADLATLERLEEV